MSKLEAGGKPSTWFPPGRLVEHIVLLAHVFVSGKGMQFGSLFAPVACYKHLASAEMLLQKPFASDFKIRKLVLGQNGHKMKFWACLLPKLSFA